MGRNFFYDFYLQFHHQANEDVTSIELWRIILVYLKKSIQYIKDSVID
jgi:hypothetical protein